jgi:pSer/pThr/pTyr-binding forkhead associated (FHA) protein
MAKITINMPGGEELKFGLDLETITIGRSDKNDIVIEDISVSSSHIELVRQSNGNFLLADLESTNGTRVNNEVVKEAYLEDGDAIRIGNIEAIYDSDVPRGERVELPEEERGEASVGESSGRPSSFSNDQPFKSRRKEVDPIGALLVTLTVFALLACALAVFFTTMMTGS